MSEDVECHASEDNTNYKAISCDQIPELFLDKIVAKKHFSQFGKIKRFILRPKRLSCTVEYENRENAERAYIESGNFNGKEFIVNYAEKEIAHVQNTEEWVDPDVQAELDAMSAVNRLGSSFRAPVHDIQKLNRSIKSSAILPHNFKTTKASTVAKADSPQPEATNICTSIRNELEKILKTPAYTEEEKYKVLDARDKLIRLTTTRQTDIKKAVATKGICPDMCPEKERLMREFQRQVSIFEMADENEGAETAISHKKAVKEYSRSSADQEVPLSHELRSESVLQMTMLYLMHRIVDLCDDPKTSLGDWFHFVWDRTRSIRKDITQQELCSLGVVELVEQCARFHIHCAARLVAEDPSVFDKKINAENLTKCLQTLKYMYHDLRIKGIHCPCEAEFRSYVILLNLGDSNFLWELKQLPNGIQKSTEIKRAIAFYNALQNNNFVRFFNMVKSSETSYLSACILLGYFTKLRVRATEAIIKSHNWRKNDVYLPLTYLTRILGFDDESSAMNFFNYYGLQCDQLDRRILLDRINKPDIEYTMDRALKLVESKRKVSVGECIFGKKLPPASVFEYHQPHSSFDHNGLLKLESWSANDQLRGEAAKTNVFKTDKYLEDVHQSKEENVFKIPQTSTYASSKIKQYSNQNEQQTIKEVQLNEFNFITEQKESGKSLPSGGFKFSGNIFEKSQSSVHALNNIFNFSPDGFVQTKNQNTFLNTVFQSTTYKDKVKADGIFGSVAANDQSKVANIFGAAAKETSNIYQKLRDNPQTSNNIFQSNSVISNIPNQSPSIVPPAKIKSGLLKNEILEDKLKLNEGLQINNKNVRDNNRQIEEFKETKSEEREKHKNDLELQIEKQSIEHLKTGINKSSEHETIKLISNFVSEEVLRIVQSEVLIRQTIKDASYLECEFIIADVIDECIKDIAHEEYALICYDQLLLNRYFIRWLLHVRKKKEQKKLMDNTPLWITTATRAQYVQALEHPSQNKNLEMIKRYRMGEPCDFNVILKMEKNILYERNENPLNLFALVGQHLLNKQQIKSCGLMQQRRYFKFLISHPSDNEEALGFGTFLNKWLINYIEKAQTDTGPFVHGLEHNMALCVRKITGIIPKNEQGDKVTTEGDHNDGVIFFISGLGIKTQSRNRLHNLLKATKNQKRIPLAVISYKCTYKREELIEILDLDSLQEEGLIYSYALLGCEKYKKHYNFREVFIGAVNFITNESYLLNTSELQALAMQNILSFLETSLGEEMFHRWNDSTKSNPVFLEMCRLPVHVIGIYHKALDHLLHITQEDFTEMPEFPEELKEFVPLNACSNVASDLEYFPSNWKDKSRADVIKKILQNLFLPEVKDNVPSDIEGLKLWLLNYASECINNDDLVVTKSVYEAISNLINQINHQNSEVNYKNSKLKIINYLNIFKPIIIARINNTLKTYQKEIRNLYVVYLKDNFENYKTQPWWLNYQPLTSITINCEENDTMLSQRDQLVNDEDPFLVSSLESIIENAELTSKKAEKRLLQLECKNLLKSEIQSDISQTSLQLKRTLDDSFYQFQLSKKIGEFDNTFITNLTQDIDKSIEKVFNKPSSLKQKRKRLSPKLSNQYSDFDEIINTATELIKKIDSNADRSVKKRKVQEFTL